MSLYYINADPHDLAASIRLDDDCWAPTIIRGSGLQHIEFDVPDSEHGHGATLRCEKAGYQADERRVEFQKDPWLADVTLEQLAPTIVLPMLVTRGQFFQQSDGAYWTAIQCSDFHLFGRYLNGEDITPILQQRQALGFNLLRVWTRYSLEAYGIGRCTLADHPDLYDRVRPFLQLCSQYGLYVELTAYTGREDFDPAHWGRLGGAVQGVQNVLLELINEADQPGNAINLSPYTQFPGVLCSHGSNGSEARPVEPFWDYATFHTNGASEWWRKNGHNAMEIWGGPTLTNEATRCPDQDQNPAHFYDAAAGAALLCAGSCFHSVHGKDSTLFIGPEIECAQAHVHGARSVPLTCQPGDYRHRSDLEGPEDLRVYQRGDASACIVEIKR